MSDSLLFQIVTFGVIPFWLLLAFLPNAGITRILVHSVVPPVILGITYVWLYQTAAGSGTTGDVTSLDGLMQFLTDRRAVLAGWIHYLVFDLFIGAWMARDARRRGMWYPVVVPCLFLTFLMGPGGLVLYLMIRAAYGRGSFGID